MADEKFYEQKLTTAVVNSLNAKQRSAKFGEAVQKRKSLIGCICGRMIKLVWISVDDAKTYINYATGQFRGGKYMPHCLDPELKRLFAELEVVTNEIHKYPFQTTTEALEVANAKTAEVGKVMGEIKKIFGETKAREIAARAKAAAIKITGINF
ncbi:MAG: hypothetical protein ACI4QI_05870 [Candidatus Coproplasma sp.]